MIQVGVGLALTAGVTAASALLWGEGGVVPAAAFGLLATAIQAVAVRLVQPVLRSPFRALAKRWAFGMGLRLVGVVLMAVAVSLDPVRFEPLPTALGYLGVVIPLLFMETRFLK